MNDRDRSPEALRLTLLIGHNINKHRTRQGLTMRALEEKSGGKLSDTWIANVESCKRVPQMHGLYVVARTLGIKVQDLFEGTI